MVDADLDKFYSTAYRDCWAMIDKDPWLRARVDAVINLLGAKPGERVLEIGCGDGLVTLAAAKTGAEVWGVDPSKPSVEAARNKAKELGVNAHFEVGSAYALPFKDGEFDRAIMTEVLEHLEDPQRGLREARRVLKPGGVISFSVPTAFHPAHLFELGRQSGGKSKSADVLIGFRKTFANWVTGKRYTMQHWKNVAPHYHYYPRALFRMVEREGFEVIARKPVVFFPQRILDKAAPLKALNALIERTPLGFYFCLTNVFACRKKQQ